VQPELSVSELVMDDKRDLTPIQEESKLQDSEEILNDRSGDYFASRVIQNHGVASVKLKEESEHEANSWEYDSEDLSQRMAEIEIPKWVDPDKRHLS